MSDTQKEEWYVTEYPVEGSFAVTNGRDIFATIIGGKTIGDECDLASRIAKLPKLERDLREARELAESFRKAWMDQNKGAFFVGTTLPWEDLLTP